MYIQVTSEKLDISSPCACCSLCVPAGSSVDRESRRIDKISWSVLWINHRYFLLSRPPENCNRCCLL